MNFEACWKSRIQAYIQESRHGHRQLSNQVLLKEMYKENELILKAVGNEESKPRSQNPGLGTESSQIQFC